MEIEDIYREVAPKLQSYLAGNGCSYAKTCDIVQETFLRIWERRAELSGDLHQVSGLAFTIARNYRNDLARKAQHGTLGDEADAVKREVEACGSVEGVRPGEAREESAVLQRRLKSSLGRMPVQLLETFALSRLGKLSVRDIASGMGVSEANVKVRVHRARELLKVLFKSEDEVKGGASVAADFNCAVLKAMMMLAAVDGEISREELSLYHEIADKFRASGAFDGFWEKSVRAMAYIGFLSEMLTPEELVREYVREASVEFAGLLATPERVRQVVSALERMASADGDYSRIERDCVRQVSSSIAT